MKDKIVHKFSDIGRIVTGKTPPTKDKDNFIGNIPFITPRDMDNNRYIENTERNLSKKGVKTVRNSYLPSFSIMVSCIGSDMGKVAINKLPCVTNQQINSIILKDGVSYLYVYYNLLTRRNELKNLASSGSALPILNKNDFSNLEINLPPLETQQKIANILGTLDDKIELNRQMNQTLEAMARAIFKSWFVDFDPVYAKMEGRDYPLPPEIMDLFPDELEESELGLIPKGWRGGVLGEIIEIHDSKRIPLSKKERSERKGNYPYYGATKIVDFVDDYLFDGVFLLVGEDGSVINDEGYPFLQYVWGQFWANNHAHVLCGKNGFSTEYIYLLLKKTNISPFITGAVQLKLNQENMKSIPIILPPQNMLIYFSNEINEYFSKIRNNDEQIEILTRLRELLLPKLVNGLLEI
jgi:type I restriction enzyme S subunit